MSSRLFVSCYKGCLNFLIKPWSNTTSDLRYYGAELYMAVTCITGSDSR